MGILMAVVLGWAPQADAQDDTLSKYLPPLRKVNVSFKDTPIEEALTKLSRVSGVPVGWNYLNKKDMVTLDIKGATPLQAFDDVCRYVKRLNYNVQLYTEWDKELRKSVPKGVRAAFFWGNFPNYPTVYIRHYALSLRNVTLTKSRIFSGPDRVEGNLGVRLMWPPDVKPEAVRLFRLEEIKDDKGKSLIDQRTNQWPYFQRIRPQKHWHQASSEPSFRFVYPQHGVKTLSLVKGKAVLRFPKKILRLTWEKPDAKESAREKEGLGLKAALVSFSGSGTSVSVSIKITGTYTRPMDPYEKIQKASWSDRLPFEYQDAHVFAEDGAELALDSGSRSGGSTDTTFRVTFANPDKKKIKAVELWAVEAYHYDEVDFELKDVLLPQ